MPRTAINYEKTIIYQIVCKDITITDKYVGHTTNFTNRKRNHKMSCNNIKNNTYVFDKKFESDVLKYKWTIGANDYLVNNKNIGLHRMIYYFETGILCKGHLFEIHHKDFNIKRFRIISHKNT